MSRNYYTAAKKTEYNGCLYDSKFESEYAQELDVRRKAHDIKSWERQVRLALVVNDYVICTYKIDFIIHHNDSTTEYIECKGYPTPVWRLKWKLFCALYQEKSNVILSVIQQGKFNIPKVKKVK